jgi:hypothetical protein
MGGSVQHQVDGLFLTQRQFTLDVLERAGMVDYKPVSTSVDTQAKFSTTFGPLVAYPTQFRSLTGGLQYLMFTRPDIAYEGSAHSGVLEFWSSLNIRCG